MTWFGVQTKTAREITASISIAEKGFTVFLPLRTVVVTHARQQRQKERALFPRYLFVTGRLNTANELIDAGKINYCRGVLSKGLMCDADGDPQPISDKIINDIRRREELARARAGEVTTGYEPGETFQIQRGRFASLSARYVGEEKGQVLAFVTMFGKDHLVELDFAEVPPSDNRIDNFAA